MNFLPQRREFLTTLVGSSVVAGCALGGQLPAISTRLHRGLNIHNAMNWANIEPWPSRDFVWPPFQEERCHISDKEIARIKAVGFDFIRFTLDPGLFIWSYGNSHADDLDEILATQVRRYLSVGLKVIVDPHPIDQHEDYTAASFVKGVGSPGFEAYATMIGRLAHSVQKIGRGVSLELMNEPQGDTPAWQPMAIRLHQIARASAGPGLTIVVPGGRVGAPEGLTSLNAAPFLNSDVIFTFHDYTPLTFTHQGALGTKNIYLGNVPWPVNPKSEAFVDETIRQYISKDMSIDRAEKESSFNKSHKIIDDYLKSKSGFEETDAVFDKVARWARSYQIPPERILLGEFGVGRTTGDRVRAPEADRLAWLTAMRTDAEKHGFAWAVWAYRGPGGMALAFEGPDPVLDPASLAALGLRATSAAGSSR